MKYLFRIRVLNEDPEGFSLAVYLRLPLKVRCNSEFHFDDTASYRLHVSLEFESRELMHEFVNDFTHLGELDNLTYLLCTHVVEMLPCELFFLFYLSQNLLRDTVILTEWCHRTPLSAFDHLARV
jgi:hypothetical protein